MELSIEVVRDDPAKLQWRLVYGIPLVGQFSPVTLTGEKVGPYPVIAPRSPATWDPAAIRAAAINIASKQVNARDTEVYGRHLFDVLIGNDMLAACQARGGLTCISLRCEDREFSSIPWEMLWIDDDFAARKGIGVTRVLGDAAPMQLQISPVVLFVVGSDLHDKNIRPGAEYLGLIRRLEATGLAIESHVLVRATTKAIEDSIRSIKPSIVHFICHGTVSSLELAADVQGKPARQVDGAQLAALLRAVPQAIPSVVVLNACNSAGSVDSTAIAHDIARSGIPVVIGMAGRVADQACRLFTRRFYEALMSGDSITVATSEARKEGILHGSNPRSTVDWAMPTLFIRHGTSVRVMEAIRKLYASRVERAQKYREIQDPGLICGRGECLDVHRQLLDDKDPIYQRVLVLKVPERLHALPDPRYGKTRAMEEFAARAVLSGHVPCLVTFQKVGDVLDAPKTPMELAKRVIAAISTTRARFGLKNDVPFEVIKLYGALASSGNVQQLSKAVRSALDLKPLVAGATEPPADVVGAALKEDLRKLAADARQKAPGANVVLLIDDVHACGEAGRCLVQRWISDEGMGSIESDEQPRSEGCGPIPLVLAYTADVPDIYKSDVQVLRSYMEQRPKKFKVCELKAFADPKDDDLPYQQFFLSHEKVLILNRDIPPGHRSSFLAGVHKHTYGVPSRFNRDPVNSVVQAVVDIGIDLGVLVEANDDDLLQRLAGACR